MLKKIVEEKAKIAPPFEPELHLLKELKQSPIGELSKLTLLSWIYKHPPFEFDFDPMIEKQLPTKSKFPIQTDPPCPSNFQDEESRIVTFFNSTLELKERLPSIKLEPLRNNEPPSPKTDLQLFIQRFSKVATLPEEKIYIPPPLWYE